MTELLKRAFEEASKLPPKEQDAFAALVLAELEAEKAWDQAFGRSHSALANLAREALDDVRAGRADVLDPEKL
jgi:hypothetical protein